MDIQSENKRHKHARLMDFSRATTAFVYCWKSSFTEVSFALLFPTIYNIHRSEMKSEISTLRSYLFDIRALKLDGLRVAYFGCWKGRQFDQHWFLSFIDEQAVSSSLTNVFGILVLVLFRSGFALFNRDDFNDVFNSSLWKQMATLGSTPVGPDIRLAI